MRNIGRIKTRNLSRRTFTLALINVIKSRHESSDALDIAVRDFEDIFVCIENRVHKLFIIIFHKLSNVIKQCKLFNIIVSV